MMFILRLLNMLTVGLLAFAVGIVISMYPLPGIFFCVCIIGVIRRNARSYDAFGTARWAEAKDIPHMLQGKGLIVGEISSRPSKIDGVISLFTMRLPSRIAVWDRS